MHDATDPILASPLTFDDGPPFFTSGAELVSNEASWRTPLSEERGEGEIIVARWRGRSGKLAECSNETPAGYHIAGIAMRNMDIRFSVDGRVACNGPLAAGSCHVSTPRQTTRCSFKGGYDVLHLFVPNRIVEECAEDLLRRNTADFAPVPIQDPPIAHLARSLVLSGQENCRELRDHIAMAIVTRLLLSTRSGDRSRAVRGSGLSRWRLRRAIEYIEANLSQPLTLADIATAAGLSRMHFAAQFRKSTGQQPHQYVLNRRVEQAQAMLVETEMPIVEIALSVGFQAQSHFTTIFKRVIGQPPHAWRCEHGTPRIQPEARYLPYGRPPS